MVLKHSVARIHCARTRDLKIITLVSCLITILIVVLGHTTTDPTKVVMGFAVLILLVGFVFLPFIVIAMARFYVLSTRTVRGE